MPATVTLSTTTLKEGVSATANEVKLDSLSGILPGYRLFVDGELMRVVSLGLDTWANVIRGVDGTGGAAHSSGVTVYIGAADHFYSQDPVGAPLDAIPVSPHINVRNGSIWFAQGDAVPSTNRWWQRQVTSFGIGALGIRTTSLDPTSST